MDFEIDESVHVKLESVGMIINENDGMTYTMCADGETFDMATETHIGQLDLSEIKMASQKDAVVFTKELVYHTQKGDLGKDMCVYYEGGSSLVDSFSKENGGLVFRYNDEVSHTVDNLTLGEINYSADVQQHQMVYSFLLGEQSVKNAKVTAPAQDRSVMKLIKGRGLGQTPDGEAATIPLMDEWQKGRAEEIARTSEAQNIRTPDEVEYIIKRLTSEFISVGEDVSSFDSKEIKLNLGMYLSEGWSDEKMLGRINVLLFGRHGDRAESWFNLSVDRDKEIMTVSFDENSISKTKNVEDKTDLAESIIDSFKTESLSETMSVLETKKRMGMKLSEDGISKIKESSLDKEQKIIALMYGGVKYPAEALFQKSEEQSVSKKEPGNNNQISL